MRTWIVSIILMIAVLAIPCQAQYARRIVPVTALPASCNPLNGEVRSLTTGGVTTLFHCTGTNTWTSAGTGSGNVLTISQGALTGASTPFLVHTATWNNAATIFNDQLITITDTASSPFSTFALWKVGAATMYSFGKAGILTVAPDGGYSFSTRSNIFSSADGLIRFMNSANAAMTRVTYGPETVAVPAITVTAAVAGQAQGITITKGDGTANVFADLGAATNGTITYCSNCTIANPCAGAGTGAIAKRLNGVWVCN